MAARPARLLHRPALRALLGPAALAALAWPAAARADRPPAYQWIADTSDDGPVFLRQVIPVAASPPGASLGRAVTRTIYLDRLGATLAPGANDSRAGTSSLVSRVTTVRGWEVSPTDWAATVACMTELWSRFDVTVTDVDPGATPHVTALFGGSPADLGMTDKVGGVSPFASDCSVIEHSIVFAFTDNLPRRPRAVCEIMAQEIAHSYGLDHELVAADPMSYLSFAGDRAFQDVAAACGEASERPCGIARGECRTSQNSVELLRARLGASDRPYVPVAVLSEPSMLGCRAGRSPGAPLSAAVIALAALAARRRRAVTPPAPPG